MRAARTLASLIEVFRADVQALGHDINVATRDGIVSILIAAHRGPGFLGEARG